MCGSSPELPPDARFALLRLLPMRAYSSVMVSSRSLIAFGMGAFVLLGLAIGVISMSFDDDHDTTFTPSPTKEVFDWLYSAPSHRFLAVAVLGFGGGAMAVATVRRCRRKVSVDPTGK